MEQQTVEVKFRAESVGSHTDDGAAYTLYLVPGDLYVVHVDKGEESWIESMGAKDSPLRKLRRSRGWLRSLI
jgi:hypothetical protein